VATVQEYMRARLVDELHLAIVPILLGSGERLFDGPGMSSAGYECVELVSSTGVVHARFARLD
jgi:dihydrofolate reductase